MAHLRLDHCRRPGPQPQRPLVEDDLKPWSVLGSEDLLPFEARGDDGLWIGGTDSGDDPAGVVGGLEQTGDDQRVVLAHPDRGHLDGRDLALPTPAAARTGNPGALAGLAGGHAQQLGPHVLADAVLAEEGGDVLHRDAVLGRFDAAHLRLRPAEGRRDLVTGQLEALSQAPELRAQPDTPRRDSGGHPVR